MKKQMLSFTLNKDLSMDFFVNNGLFGLVFYIPLVIGMFTWSILAYPAFIFIKLKGGLKNGRTNKHTNIY